MIKIKSLCISSLLICAALTSQAVFAAFIDQNKIENSEMLRQIEDIHSFDTSKLSPGVKVAHINPDLTAYTLIPSQANQTWKISLIDFSKKIDPHYHLEQNQLIIVMEGELTTCIDNEEMTLLPGQYALIPHGKVHDLTPSAEGCRFLVVDLPGFDFPEDAFHDKPLPPIEHKIDADQLDNPYFIDDSINLEEKYLEKLDLMTLLDPKYYQVKFDKGEFTAYSLVSPQNTNQKWSLALLEINNSPKHYHLKGTERFIVLNGELNIEVNGVNHHLKAGHSVRVSPKTIHHLRSATEKPVRLLCINHPSFDPNDHYPVN